jgi:hypothetical protein
MQKETMTIRPASRKPNQSAEVALMALGGYE